MFYSNQRIRSPGIFILSGLLLFLSGNHQLKADTTSFCTHRVVLDSHGKILPWYSPQEKAYDNFLRIRWNFVKTRVPGSPGPAPRSQYPQYYFYCAFKDQAGNLQPDTWMNDPGEKLPNWFESARLYYSYTGDSSVMKIVKDLADYYLDHGTSKEDFTWPSFPYTTTNAGDTVFLGFTSAGRFKKHEIQVDHAGEIGLTYLRIYQYSNDARYLKAAINIADVLARHAIEGNERKSVWPYRITMDNGKITAPYGANWTGCYQLLHDLVSCSNGDLDAYREAMEKARKFILNYPMRTGYWTDGHSDNNVSSNKYRSNLSASNAVLFLADHPEFDPDWKSHIPMLIRWTEDNFIQRCAPGEPSSMWGANIAGEQDSFLYKMDYQTARYAAECARWYALSGNEEYREKAFRSLNWVTYCNDSSGMAFESPVSKGILSWWSDSYGECPRMFYHAFAGMPELAPPHEDHILYSPAILRNVNYSAGMVSYSVSSGDGPEYLRISFMPSFITVNDNVIQRNDSLLPGTFRLKSLGNGDYALTIMRNCAGNVVVSGIRTNIKIDITSIGQRYDGVGVNANTGSWDQNLLKPAIDILADSMHLTPWRVIAETVENWEVENDNDDPFTFNQDFYNSLYETPKFRKVWDMVGYLNSKGINDKLMLNIMGRLPAWIGDSIILPEKEDEYVELLSSFLYYARNVRHLQFGLFGPMNEPDIRKEGPTVGPQQYARVLRKLIDRMNSLGLGDIGIVAPDVAGMGNGISKYLPLMLADPVIMKNLAHIGLHSYGGYYAPASEFLRHSPYPASSLWITEWNAWRNGLDDGVIGLYDFRFARESVSHLISLLNGGAESCMVWEGYDSYYEHHAPSPFSYWGILGYDAEKQTYYPRKHLYAIAQFSKFVPQGSFRLVITDTLKIPLTAFSDRNTGKISIVGINEQKAPRILDLEILNAFGLSSMELYVTGEKDNLRKLDDCKVSNGTLEVTIPADCIFTLTGTIPPGNLKANLVRPEPAGWYSGDMHVHRNCGDVTSTIAESQLARLMEPNDLSVISLLADMGNGEVKDSRTDLPKVNGSDAKESLPGRIIHWDAEWHFDPAGVTFENKALGGHLVFLGLKQAKTIWNESPFRIIEWAKGQGAVTGFCHMQYLTGHFPEKLDCCTPLDFPVEAALGTVDFLAEDVWQNDASVDAYYKLLNCGFRIGWAAGTDYPCNGGAPPGSLLTWVNLKGNPLTYSNWIDGIRHGRTVVVTDGNTEFLDLKVNQKYTPGDEIFLESEDSVEVDVKWTTVKELSGRIELVLNGNVVKVLEGTSGPSKPVTLKSVLKIPASSWLCARRMNEKGHQSHTSPVYITLRHQPVRASAADARYYISWIDNLLERISPGGPWNIYLKSDLREVEARYRRARNVYVTIARQAIVGYSSKH